MSYEIQLGYCDEPEGTLSWTHSYVGGKPSWLIPKGVPTATRVTCSQCNAGMLLLLQLYAPLDTNPDAYHRVIYVFICKSKQCHESNKLSCFKVLRAQLPDPNAFYEPVDDDYDGGDDEDSVEESGYRLKDGVECDSLCEYSGLLGRYSCSRCKSVRYASQEFQALDWKLRHKAICSIIENGAQLDSTASASAMSMAPPLLVMTQIITEPAASNVQRNPSAEEVAKSFLDTESDSEEDDDDDDELQNMNQEELKKFMSSSNASEFKHESLNENDFTNNANHNDPYFRNFVQLIKDESDQVLRYYEDPNMIPLLISKHQQPDLALVPLCPHCQSPRRCEFQILPQLLNHLRLNDASKTSLSHFDWGLLTVFTCSKSCSSTADGYLEEYIWVQDVDPTMPDTKEKESTDPADATEKD